MTSPVDILIPPDRRAIPFVQSVPPDLPMDPIAMERRFQSLVRILPLLGSTREKLHAIAGFHESILRSGHAGYPAAYLPELREPFLRTLAASSFAGTRPTCLRRLRAILDQWGDWFPAWTAEADWEEAAAHLVTQQDQMRGQLEAKRSSERRSAPRMHLHRRDHRVHFPVVECELLDGRWHNGHGALRSIRVGLQYRHGSEGEDEILVDQSVDPEGSQHRLVRRSLAAARVLVRVHAHADLTRGVVVRCSFDEPNVLVGESCGAALTLALYSEMLRLLEIRDQILLRWDVAVTGALADDGYLLAVDADGLREKVVACACSWIRTLVVPHGQERIARQALEEFRDEPDPRPFVDVIGATDLASIIHDRRLTDLYRTPWPKHVARWAWRYRRVIVGAVMAILLGSALDLW